MSADVKLGLTLVLISLVVLGPEATVVSFVAGAMYGLAVVMSAGFIHRAVARFRPR